MRRHYHTKDDPPCRQCWEAETSVCAGCWQPVRNKDFFGVRGNSPHITGKCRTRPTVPASALERLSTKPRSYLFPLATFWRTSEEARKRW